MSDAEAIISDDGGNRMRIAWVQAIDVFIPVIGLHSELRISSDDQSFFLLQRREGHRLHSSHAFIAEASVKFLRNWTIFKTVLNYYNICLFTYLIGLRRGNSNDQTTLKL